jgi:hypothetical protein
MNRMAREHCPTTSSLSPLLTDVQSRLLDLGSHIATPLKTSTAKQLGWLLLSFNILYFLSISTTTDILPPSIDMYDINRTNNNRQWMG